MAAVLTLRLEQVSWEAIDEICVSEGVSLHELCSMIEGQRSGSSRTSTVRAFIVTYFRQAATNQGKALGGTASSILPEMGDAQLGLLLRSYHSSAPSGPGALGPFYSHVFFLTWCCGHWRWTNRPSLA